MNVKPVNYRKLQNGSDIRGVALPGVSGEEVNLTPYVAKRLGKSFVTWLSQSLDMSASTMKIAVGTDSRLSGKELKKHFVEGITDLGGKVLDAGMATTPAMFMATQFRELNCHGAVMLTASHLPFNRNGFKFFTRESGLDKQNIKDILEIAATGEWIFADGKGKTEEVDLISLYSEFLCSKISQATQNDLPLKGRKIIVDAGNGAGGFFAEKVLKTLGADIAGSQFLEPDGNFPNHIPNPEDKDAIASISKAVIREKADLGIIFDTDVDRSAVVDSFGNPIHRNRLIALLSAIILEEHPGSIIVTDSVTSEGLAEFIKKRGGVHFRYRRGYKNVINKSIELNHEGKESWLAIETSGHGALKENYFLDDGAFMTAKILIKFAELTKLGKNIESLIEDLKEPFESREFRIPIRGDEFQPKGEKIIEKVRTFAEATEGWEIEPENYEGVRVRCDDRSGNGWFLLRLSLHDPVLPLNVESQDEGGVTLIVSKLHGLLKEINYIKTDSLT